MIAGISSWAASGPVGASARPPQSPPSTIASDCTRDVSAPMQRWLSSLPAGTTVVSPPGSCYLVDEGLRIVGAQGLTISGGTWRDATTPVRGAPAVNMPSVFWLVGGSGITLENLTVAGVSPGGYNPSGAFNAGVRSDGVIGFTVANVVVNNVYGDGVELAPLRGAGDWSNEIINPTMNATVTNVVVNGAGRQGVTLASVTNATISAVSLRNVAMNAFDLEADQWNEGAKNVLINGCTVGSGIGALFFANGGAGGGGAWTSNITVQNCVMTTPAGGDVILVRPPSPQNPPRGPITFVSDRLQCGSSVYVSCVEVTNGQVAVEGSTLQVPSGTVHEPVFDSTVGTTLVFGSDVVSGYGVPGNTDRWSSTTISGGSWKPYIAPITHPSPGPTPGTQGPPTMAHLTGMATGAPGGRDIALVSESTRAGDPRPAGDRSRASASRLASVTTTARTPGTLEVELAASGLALVALALTKRRESAYRRTRVPSTLDLLGNPLPGFRPARASAARSSAGGWARS